MSNIELPLSQTVLWYQGSSKDGRLTGVMGYDGSALSDGFKFIIYNSIYQYFYLDADYRLYDILWTFFSITLGGWEHIFIVYVLKNTWKCFFFKVTYSCIIVLFYLLLTTRCDFITYFRVYLFKKTTLFIWYSFQTTILSRV